MHRNLHRFPVHESPSHSPVNSPVGAPGHSRSVSLPVSATVIHAPETCAGCGQALEPAKFIAGTGVYVLDIETEPDGGLGGIRVRHDKHLYGEITCAAGMSTAVSQGVAQRIPCGPSSSANGIWWDRCW